MQVQHRQLHNKSARYPNSYNFECFPPTHDWNHCGDYSPSQMIIENDLVIEDLEAITQNPSPSFGSGEQIQSTGYLVRNAHLDCFQRRGFSPRFAHTQNIADNHFSPADCQIYPIEERSEQSTDELSSPHHLTNCLPRDLEQRQQILRVLQASQKFTANRCTIQKRNNIKQQAWPAEPAITCDVDCGLRTQQDAATQTTTERRRRQRATNVRSLSNSICSSVTTIDRHRSEDLYCLNFPSQPDSCDTTSTSRIMIATPKSGSCFRFRSLISFGCLRKSRSSRKK